MGTGPPAPMLASTGPLPSGPGWAYEFKWDGIRAIAVISGGETRLYARSGVEVTAAYPELATIGEGLDDTVLDGEVVTMDEAGRPSFQLLAERMHVREPARAARLAVALPVSYLAFDVLRSSGRPLLSMPYTGRRDILEGLRLGPRAVIPPSFDDGPATVTASRDNALEGVVAKRTGSPYQPGLRSADWVKVKLEESCEFVVGGWRPGKRALGALLVGVPVAAGLEFRGRVGGGISGAAERALLDALRDLTTGRSPFAGTVPREDARGAVWVEPRLVVEVKFSHRTRDGRLRFPRFLRIRPDLTPADVTDA
ncbi:non-homologous end-joining DNA ligase [Dactylosporangium aurantiacum]|uniref:DNA ligase (ATP) n=1 Tax=Dactylosporangium aurantiacum TaxID=35754 RepID=A0A9Q9MDM0_9ACTN|nr:non-homologous end-joining DNA ligase [Dactylosporangium aurantiacum]MDG6100687.1 non-homologous end-joining DNA ligase [Dactylosporangium aurantiacum]UWZ55238.1 non-homologous end-joining DNA ligase [Dactylosporangium aurantiacum]